ncbi:LRR 8 domain containing protein [Asbolus verrucosus]|uniref:LRR 8 domain containing protein n=1 Tax=Asbolus verrucosus TaxID=1661398 RepID=A0A482V196_ASBVE|nr:LRR 8 domain containing protein [Asbolus verrucosus]
MLLVLILILCNSKPIASATFENIEVGLSFSNDKRIVVITSDNYLNKYVHQADEVTIKDQKISKLVENSVTDLTGVIRLHMTRCGIEEIRPGAFKNLPLLKELNLSNNLLKEIKNGVFANLPFDTLYLENNRIAKIENKAFNNLALANLFMDNNRISTWNSEWFYGTRLIGISMGNNLIENLPRRSFEYLAKLNLGLVYLILNNNKLKSIDPDAFEGLKEASYLSFQNNLLEFLEPGLFDSVQQIYTLELNNNKIREVYYETFRNTKLSEINLKNNLLSCISTDIFNATRMTKIYVHGNPIKCHCVEYWEKWKKNKKLEIDNFNGLKKNCISVANSCRFYIFLFVLTLLVFAF